MELLIAIGLAVVVDCAEPRCDYVAVGCHEYAPTQCALDVFYAWGDVPPGHMPAHCDASGVECLPLDWEGCAIVRRTLEDCTC